MRQGGGHTGLCCNAGGQAAGGVGRCTGGGHVVLGGDTGTVEVPDARSPEGSYV